MKTISVGDFHITDGGKKKLIKVIESNNISEGKFVKEFENKFAQYVGTKYAVAVNSGTSALIAALTAVLYNKDLKNRNKKVITTPLNFIATINAITLTGYEPVFVDVEKESFNIDPDMIETILDKTKKRDDFSLILPVHLFGYPCKMEEINKIAKKYNISVIEDSSQSHGSLYKNKKTGSLSLLSTFSFYMAHSLQAGEMGAVLTNSNSFYNLCKKIKVHGRICNCIVCQRKKNRCPYITKWEHYDNDIDPKFTHDLIGYNFKITEFQAALALAQLENIERILVKKRDNVRFLNKHLSKYSDILALPPYKDDVSYLAYPVVIKPKCKLSRKDLRSKLEKNGIETRPLFSCIPLHQKAYSHYRHIYIGKLPNAEYLATNGFYIGCHQYLTEGDLAYIVKILDSIFK